MLAYAIIPGHLFVIWDWFLDHMENSGTGEQKKQKRRGK